MTTLFNLLPFRSRTFRVGDGHQPGNARSVPGVPSSTALTMLRGAKEAGDGISLTAMAAFPEDPRGPDPWLRESNPM